MALNVKLATASAEEQVTLLADDFVSPYYGRALDDEGNMTDDSVDVVARMFYPKRAKSARPLSEELVASFDESVLNRLICATGAENNQARFTRQVVRTWFNWTRKDDGSILTVDKRLDIVKASKVIDITIDDDGNMTPKLVSVLEFMTNHGLIETTELKKLARKSGETLIAIPLVLAFNSIMSSRDGKGYMGSLACTGFMSTGADKNEVPIDLRVMSTYMKAADFEAAIAIECDGDEEAKTRVVAHNFVKTAILFAYRYTEILRVAQDSENNDYLPRDYYAMWGAKLSEVYYGKSEFSDREFHQFHGIISGVFDLATLGGGFADVPAERIVAGEGWNLPALNERAR